MTFGIEKLTRFAGPMLPATEVHSKGGDYAKYEAMGNQWLMTHWNQSGRNWEADYYNCGAIEYVWWARTGDEVFKQQARAKAVDYRVKYLEANGYNSSAHWAMLQSVFFDWCVTGDEASKTALGRLATLFTAPYYVTVIAQKEDNRIQSRVLTALLYAHLAGIVTTPAGGPWPGGLNVPATLRKALTAILATQSADGSYMFPNASNGTFNKVFMVCLLNQAMIEYHELFERDPRILSSVQRSCDYMWSKQFDQTKLAWYYPGNAPPVVSTETDVPEIAPGLNGLALPAWGWLYKMIRDTEYKTQGDLILKGAMAGTWFAGQKEFNQTYLNSYRYFAWIKGVS